MTICAVFYEINLPHFHHKLGTMRTGYECRDKAINKAKVQGVGGKTQQYYTPKSISISQVGKSGRTFPLIRSSSEHQT